MKNLHFLLVRDCYAISGRQIIFIRRIHGNRHSTQAWNESRIKLKVCCSIRNALVCLGFFRKTKADAYGVRRSRAPPSLDPILMRYGRPQSELSTLG